MKKFCYKIGFFAIACALLLSEGSGHAETANPQNTAHIQSSSSTKLAKTGTASTEASPSPAQASPVTAASSTTSVETHAELQVKDVRLYQGQTWIADQAFVAATDENGQALPFSKIAVKGAVDSQTVGTYQLTYSYGQISKTVTVNVLPSKASLVVKNTTISYGAKWQATDNFVAATAADGSNLSTDKIAVSGTVNSTKAGNYTLTYSSGSLEKTVTVTVTAPDITYQGQVQRIGWQGLVKNGAMSGTTGQGLRLEAFKISMLNLASNAGNVSYQAYVQGSGWQTIVSNGNIAGTVGRGLRMEALRINLSGTLGQNYDIYYRVHAQDLGWMGWTKNGATAGTTNMALRIEALEIRLVPKGTQAPGSTELPYLYPPTINYQVHVQSIGWQNTVSDGTLAGTVGRSLRLEGLKIFLSNLAPGLTGGVAYQAHVQGIGWQSYRSNGQLAGTTGQSKRIEALNIHLTGALAKYFNLYYQGQVQAFGWLDWAKNGQNIGTAGIAARLESLRIKLTANTMPSQTTGKSAFLSFSQITPTSFIRGNTVVETNFKGSVKTHQFAPVYYSQLDNRWSWVNIGGYSFGSTGCAMTDVAMIAQGYGINLSPIQAGETGYQIANFNHSPNGSSESDIIAVARYYGLKARVLNSPAEIANQLSQGHAVTIAVQYPFVNYTGATHDIILFGYSNGNTYVYDPWNGEYGGFKSLSYIWNCRSTWAMDNNVGSSPAVLIYF